MQCSVAVGVTLAACKVNGAWAVSRWQSAFVSVRSRPGARHLLMPPAFCQWPPAPPAVMGVMFSSSTSAGESLWPDAILPLLLTPAQPQPPLTTTTFCQ